MPAESPIQARSTEALSGPVSDFLRSTGDKPYRKVVEYHMRRQSAELLTKAMWGEVSALPEGFRSYVETFIDAVNGRIDYDQRFWQQSTCRQGFDVIMEVANPVFSSPVPSSRKYRIDDFRWQLRSSKVARLGSVRPRSRFETVSEVRSIRPASSSWVSPAFSLRNFTRSPILCFRVVAITRI